MRLLMSSLIFVFLATGLALADATSDFVAKLQKETGITFTIPEGLKASIVKGEMQLQHDPDTFIVMASGTTLDATFDANMNVINQMAGKTVKAEHEPKTEVDEGVKGKFNSGTLELSGKKGTWVVFAFDAGAGKTLSMLAIGDDLKASAEFKALIQSIKKR